ncbi:SDR family NAD(P)-dependent oxidoreductase [Streptomyces sp. SudanB91_2054]|uniref:SDR family NAD(P)-dependent oxidoreductase n=1 Tax=Streptomyces sp. SudanB91_2054 TaxID=3035278 RepID=UPI0036D95F95
MPTADRDVVLVTGATSGLGLRLAEVLAAQGATVLAHGRDRARVRALTERLTAAGGTVRPYCADLSSLREVRTFARRVAEEQPRVDVLVNNAGVGPGPQDGARELSTDGHELRFAVGYLAPYVLTRALVPRLLRARAGRVVNVGSGAQVEIDFDDLTMAGFYNGWIAYGRAKLALASLTVDLAAELGPRGVAVSCVHPADLMPTPMVRRTGLAPRSTLDQGAEAVLRLIHGTGGADTQPGHYYNGLRPESPHPDVLRPDRRERLRRVTEELLAAEATAADICHLDP